MRRALAEWKNCQNGTFEPVHEIQNFFWPKAQSAGINLQSPQSDSTPWTLTLGNPHFGSLRILLSGIYDCTIIWRLFYLRGWPLHTCRVVYKFFWFRKQNFFCIFCFWQAKHTILITQLPNFYANVENRLALDSFIF